MTDLTAVATAINKPPIVIMRERFESRKTELKNALPSDVSPDVFIRAFMTSAQLNPELQACTWSSLWDAALRACRDGLIPDGVEAAVVPYKSRAQYIRMYQGVLRQFRRSGQFKWLKADVVRQGEKFEYWTTNAGEHFLHVPGEDFEAPIVKAYALATTKDGGEFSKVMTLAEINKHRAYSRAMRDDSPWKVWFEAMAIKTVILQLAKTLPNARDYVGNDDVPAIDEAPDPAPAASIARAPSAAAVLEQFASAATAADLSQPGDDTVINHDRQEGAIAAPAGEESQVDVEPTAGDLIGKAQRHPPKDPETFKLLVRQIIAAARPGDAKMLDVWWKGANARALRNAAQLGQADITELATEVSSAIAQMRDAAQ